MRVLGSVSLDELERALLLEFPHEDCDTVSGLALAIYGEIPADGTAFTVQTELLSIEVECVKDFQVESAVIRKLLPDQAENVQSEE